MTATTTTNVATIPRIQHDEAMAIAAVEGQKFAAQLRSFGPDDWARPTDCPDWDVRAMAGHVLGMAQMGGASLGLGRPERGAVLMGASDEALRRLGVDPSPGDTPELERVAAALREELGDERLEELLAEGARISLDEAVELALSDE